MAWVPVNRSVFTHRKTMKLADVLDLPEVYAVAHLTALWTWAMDNAPSGIIPADTSARMIARAAEYPGAAQTFVDALLASQYLSQSDEGYEIPNWMEYGGKLLVQQERNATKQALYRKRKDSLQEDADLLPLRDGNVTVELPSREEEKRIEKSRVEENTHIPPTPIGNGAENARATRRDPMEHLQRQKDAAPVLGLGDLDAPIADLYTAYRNARFPGSNTPLVASEIRKDLDALQELHGAGITPEQVTKATQRAIDSWSDRSRVTIKAIASQVSALLDDTPQKAMSAGRTSQSAANHPYRTPAQQAADERGRNVIAMFDEIEDELRAAGVVPPKGIFQ
jgi:hypothetical protein